MWKFVKCNRAAVCELIKFALISKSCARESEKERERIHLSKMHYAFTTAQ